MRKIIFIGLLVLLSTLVYGQISFSTGIIVGMDFGTYIYNGDNPMGNRIEIIESDVNIDLGVFFDATYVRLFIEYVFNFSQSGEIKEWGDEFEYYENIDPPDGFSWTMLNIGLLGKFPFNLGSITLWPAAGILYSMPISMDSDGDGENDDLSNNATDDFYLSFGGGGDIYITKNIFITFSTLFHWNTTPLPVKDLESDDSTSATWFLFSMYIGAGFKF